MGLTSTYQTADGASHAAGDVWLDQGAATPAAKPAAAPAPAAGLRGSVTSLVQALSSFDGSAAAGAVPRLDLAAALKNAQSATVSTSVAQMADVLKRFDADGKLLAGSTTAAPTDSALRLNALHNAGGHGFLASPSK